MQFHLSSFITSS